MNSSFINSTNPQIFTMYLSVLDNILVNEDKDEQDRPSTHSH